MGSAQGAWQAWSSIHSAPVSVTLVNVLFPRRREVRPLYAIDFVIMSHTSTSFWNLKLLLFSFSNSYLPYSWWLPYETNGANWVTCSSKISPIRSTMANDFCLLFNASRSLLFTAIMSWTFQNTCSRKSRRRASGMTSDVFSLDIQTWYYVEIRCDHTLNAQWVGHLRREDTPCRGRNRVQCRWLH